MKRDHQRPDVLFSSLVSLNPAGSPGALRQHRVQAAAAGVCSFKVLRMADGLSGDCSAGGE